jgi:crossover junction endodeoxyribonuclease RuvC
MIILGVDPGLAVTGYGVVEVVGRKGLRLKEAGVIRTSRGQPIEKRLLKIYEGLHALAREYKPEVLVLEKLYSHYKHPMTSILMAHARGTACFVAGYAGMKLINLPSTRIKKAITGAGHASKVQVQGMVTQILGLKKRPEPFDVTDALAAAMAYVHEELR